MVEVDVLLTAAFHREPSADLPWSEWSEIRGLIDLRDDLSAEIEAREAGGVQWLRIGYRRRSVEVRLPSGWWVRVPGVMGTRWEDRATWWAEDGERTARITVVDRHDRASLPLPQRAMNADQLVHEGGEWRGAARLLRVEDDPDVRVLEGRMVGPESEVRLSVSFSQPGDRRWAEGVFRSLRWTGPVVKPGPSAPA